MAVSTLYHATPRDFDAFDVEFAGGGEGHPNSALGIWFAPTDSWLGGFGHRVIEAEVDLGRAYPMTVGTLSKLSMEHRFDEDGGVGFFRSLRLDLLAQGYHSIDIVEDSGSVDMHVVLHHDRVLAMRDLVPGGPAPR